MLHCYMVLNDNHDKYMALKEILEKYDALKERCSQNYSENTHKTEVMQIKKI